MSTELLRIIDAIHRDKDIEKEVLFESIEAALLTAARKKYGANEDIVVHINRQTGDLEASGTDEDISPIELGRIAAQTAKQVIIQKIREAEQDVILREYAGRTDTIVTGTVQRFESGNMIVNLGKAEGLLPKSEMVRGESYHIGDRIRAYVLEVKRVGSKVYIILSRSHPELVKKLFELEIPEFADGIIEIKRLVREPGYRTKVAVSSLDLKIDCVGACVGVRGSRIRSIIDELNGEKIDIIRWNESSEILIKNALKPAEVAEIELNYDTREATVIVDEDQLSLAIGKKGQNVRLAAKLCGWDINIITHSGERASIIGRAEEGSGALKPPGPAVPAGAGTTEGGEALDPLTRAVRAEAARQRQEAETTESAEPTPVDANDPFARAARKHAEESAVSAEEAESSEDETEEKDA